MKKTFIIAGILAAATGGVYAQSTAGTLNWYDSQPNFLLEIYSPNPSNPTVSQTGEGLQDTPAGSTTYYGGFIGGGSANGSGVGPTPSSGPGGIDYQTASAFEVGLYEATSLNALTTAIDSGSPLATSTMQGGSDDGLWGTSGSLVYNNSSLVAGTQVYIGLAAWYDGTGAGSYSAAISGGSPAGYTESTVSEALGGNPPGGGTPINTPGLTGLGLTSFSLATSVPEPSTIALGLMGASALFMRIRRRK